MKISWGVKIIIAFVLFGGGIGALVAVSFSRNIDLVSENYYEQEIGYQKHIEILKNSSALDRNISVSMENNFIVIKFNSLEDYSAYSGTLHFYRSSDARKDFKIDYKPDESGVQKIPSEELNYGLWKIMISLQHNGRNYFTEKSLFVK